MKATDSETRLLEGIKMTVAELVSQLRGVGVDTICARLDELEAERKALRVLLRVARAAARGGQQ